MFTFVRFIFTRDLFWHSTIVLTCELMSLCVCVCLCVRQQRVCPRDNSSLSQVRTTLVKIAIVLRVDWLWPPRSNLKNQHFSKPGLSTTEKHNHENKYKDRPWLTQPLSDESLPPSLKLENTIYKGMEGHSPPFVGLEALTANVFTVWLVFVWWIITTREWKFTLFPTLILCRIDTVQGK